jgi:hypothetical protein
MPTDILSRAHTSGEASSLARMITVFLSCPGDLSEVKNELTAAVREVGNLLQPFGMLVSPWRHESHALPGLGVDAQEVVTKQLPEYDVYVGLLCNRLGTPTRRAASGTVEEFNDARLRFLETGRPDILFYICANPRDSVDPGEQRQLQRVMEFRDNFPGLFASFDSIGGLRTLFKDHLIDLMLREIRGDRQPPRPWLAHLGAVVDAAGPRDEYLDRSSGFAQRVIEKLRSLVDIATTLHAHEIDALLAAAHLRALQCRGADTTPARNILREVPGTGDWLEEAAIEIAAYAPADTANSEMRVENIRCGFVSALLQLGELLDLDHAGLAKASPVVAPDLHDDLRHWLAYCTRWIEVRRPAIVIFHMLVPRGADEREKRALERCRSLTFESEWQARRAILTVNGVALSRAPIQISGSATVDLPAALIPRLEAAAGDAAKSLPRLLHLSVNADGWPPVDRMLPLPRSAVMQEFVVRWEPGRSCGVELWTADRLRLIASLPPSESGVAHLAPYTFGPTGSTFIWELIEEIDECVTVLESGEVWTLGTQDRVRWDIACKLDSSARRAWQMSLGLWNDLLGDLWPQLTGNTASLQEAEVVYDVLLASYEWLRKNAPESGRIDTIRRTSQMLHRTYFNSLGSCQ